jgi:tRNA (guanine-N7-)-methyltransferase
MVVTNPQIYKGRWMEFFKAAAPLHVELGTGKGNFITTLARNNPNINYLGIEMKPEALVSALFKGADLEAQGNLGLLLFNVNHILDAFAPGEVDRLYINFCDPWPKKRHAKRRLTHHQFLNRYRQILKPGGEIHLKTDNEALFEFSLNEFSEYGFRLRNITFDLHRSEYTENIMTEYEQKFAEQGMRIYRCEAILLE